MQDRRASLTGSPLKLTFAINASCLAKERCISEIGNPEKKYIYIFGGQFFKGTKDLLKLRPGTKRYFWSFDYSGFKSQSAFCVGVFMENLYFDLSPVPRIH
jgi:hypothetical protein